VTGLFAVAVRLKEALEGAIKALKEPLDRQREKYEYSPRSNED
jgi:hypothetical protein